MGMVVSATVNPAASKVVLATVAVDSRASRALSTTAVGIPCSRSRVGHTRSISIGDAAVGTRARSTRETTSSRTEGVPGGVSISTRSTPSARAVFTACRSVVGAGAAMMPRGRGDSARSAACAQRRMLAWGSASIRRTDAPELVSARAVNMESVDFPTPPLEWMNPTISVMNDSIREDVNTSALLYVWTATRVYVR